MIPWFTANRFEGVSLVLALFAVVASAAEPPGSASESEAGRTPWADVVEADFPFFSSVLDARTVGNGLPTNNLTPRGLILNLGHECWACFDTDLLRMSAVWTGKGVTPISMAQGSYHVSGAKALEGQQKLPQPLGTVWMANGIYPGWQAGESLSLTDPRDPGPDLREVGRGPISPSAGRFNAIRLSESGACLEYEVAGASVSEWVTARVEEGRPIVQRRFHLSGVPQPLWLLLGRKPSRSADSLVRTSTPSDKQADKAVRAPILDQSSSDAGNLKWVLTARQAAGKAVAERAEQADGLLVVRVHPSEKAVEFTVAFSRSPDVASLSPIRGEGQGEGTRPLSGQTQSPRKHWPQTLTTRATLSGAKDAYVVDNIPLPLDNPWKRNVRLADIAFFRDGRAAAVTFDGDIWMLSGLRGELKEVSWRRFASGLHEPLGLCVRGDDLFVFDRNGIWRLRDTDGDGEADVHELFANNFTQTAETREYAQAIKVAPDGSFIIGKAGIEFASLGKHNGTVLRISPDGRSTTVLAQGLRSPFVGVHPKTGLVTATDQQGYYVPATPVHIIRDGQFYGFLPAIVPKEKYPAPIADPLTWIPHPINASAAGQVWLTDARMGPLNDALIHLGYNRPEIFRVLLNQRAPRMQAAVVSLTRNLDFAPLGGAVNPIDGQLYVTGFQIFGTTAKQISGLARLRYTGAPSTLPREVAAMDKGILLRFDVALDARRASDPSNYSAERWNYVRTANYGSPHFKLDGRKGQDAMTPSSAYLSKDRRSVFVGIPDMKPVMQVRVGWALATHEGATFEQNAYFTPYELTRFDPAAEGFEPLIVDLTPRSSQAAAVQAPVTAEEGKRISELMGCVTCHSTDGSMIGKVGPTWKGLFGNLRVFADGSKAVANEAYLRESIREPSSKVVSGFEKSDTGMPSYEGVISDGQIESLILYIKTLH